MKKKSQPRHLEDIVSGLIRRWEEKDLKKGNAVRTAWKAAAGEKATGHTQPAGFKKGTLMMIVENSAWLYKLTLEKRDIIKKFNENYTGR